MAVALQFGLAACSNQLKKELVATQNTETKQIMNTTLEWAPGVCAPKLYPVEVYRGDFYTDNDWLSIPNGGIVEAGWGDNGMNMGEGSLIPDGFSITYFSYLENKFYTGKFALPKELTGIPGPLIGYIGDINSLRLDPDLIYELAKARPHYSFIMTGREDKVFAAHALHTLKNVHFTGSIPKDRVPEFMSAFQVCLNPQLINEITIGNYPRKVDEYLAMGKPVVATTTGTMQLFKEHVYLCNNAAEYMVAVDQALASDNETLRKQRISFARSHSWENNVRNIYNQIQQSLN